MDEEEETYHLTKGACIVTILTRYGIDTDRLTMTIAEHMLNDLMELLCLQGYAERKEEHDETDV